MNEATPLDDRDLLQRRPLVVVEDQIHHVSELLELVHEEASSLLASLAQRFPGALGRSYY